MRCRIAVFRNVCSETRQRQRQDLWWGRSSFWMKRNVSCFGKKPSLDEIKCLRWDARPAVGGGWFELFCTIMGNKEATAMHSRRAPDERWQNHLDRNMRWFLLSEQFHCNWSIMKLRSIAFVIKLNVLGCGKNTQTRKIVASLLSLSLTVFAAFSVDKWKQSFWILNNRK